MRKWKLLSRVWLFATPCTIQSMEFSRPEWVAVPFFPTQGLNPDLLHCRRFLYQLSHKESQRILDWVAYPFSRGSFQPRNRTGVTCIAGGFFTSWAAREVIVESCLLIHLQMSEVNLCDCLLLRIGHITLCFSFIYQKIGFCSGDCGKKNLDSIIFQWGVLNLFVLSGN